MGGKNRGPNNKLLKGSLFLRSYKGGGEEVGVTTIALGGGCIFDGTNPKEGPLHYLGKTQGHQRKVSKRRGIN